MSGLVVQPGDTVIVQLSERGPADQKFVEVVGGQLREALPGCKVLIVSGVEALAAYRPGAAGGGDE